MLEQKLVNLLQPLEKNEKSMVKLDAIFKALGVETENDVKLLAQYFVNHRQYKELIKNNAYVHKNTEDQTHSSIPPQNTENINEENPTTNLTDLLDNEDQASNLTIPADIIKLIHPNEAVLALKSFVNFHHKSERYFK